MVTMSSGLAKSRLDWTQSCICSWFGAGGEGQTSGLIGAFSVLEVSFDDA